MIVAFAMMWFGWAVPQTRLLSYGQPSAALYEDQLVVAIVGHLYRGHHDLTRPIIQSPLRYRNYIRFAKTTDQAKLAIRDDRLLLFRSGGVHTIVPMVDLQLLEVGNFADKLCRLRGHESQWDFVIEHSNDTPTRLLFPPHRKPDAPLPPPQAGIGFGQGTRLVDPEIVYTETARYDIQIASPKSVRLFHAHKDSLFVSIEPDYLGNWYLDKEGNVRKNLPKPPERELRTGKLPADFTEHFAVYTSDKRDYLVTPNGKVYLAVSKGKTEVDVTKVWDDPKRRIVGVVQDSENDAVFGWGFVTDSAAPERFFVKFDPKPVAVGYKRTVPLWGDRSNAYLESYECARAFRKAAEKK